MFNPDGPHYDARSEVPDVLTNERQEPREDREVAVGDTVSAMTPQGIDHECVVDTIDGEVCSVKDSWEKIIPMSTRALTAYQIRPEVMESRQAFRDKSLIASGRELKIKSGNETRNYRIRDVLRGGGNNLVLEEIGPDGRIKSTASFSREEVMNNLVEATPSPDARYQAGDTVMIHSASLGKPVAWEVVGPANSPGYDYHVKRAGDDGREVGKDVAKSEIMGAI